jgi:uncharacterized lipoprotein YehR (DUF1307 family)
MEETQFAEAITLREAGVQIPDDVVIENSHLLRKNEIAKRVRDMQGMGDPTPEQIQMQELQIQMQIKNNQLQLQELEAKIGKLQAEQALTMEKARSEGRSGEEYQMDYQLEVAKLKGAIAQKAADLQTSLELAGIHTSADMQKTMFQSLSQRTTAELGNRTTLQVAGLNARAKSLPSPKAKT